MHISIHNLIKKMKIRGEFSTKSPKLNYFATYVNNYRYPQNQCDVSKVPNPPPPIKNLRLRQIRRIFGTL